MNLIVFIINLHELLNTTTLFFGSLGCYSIKTGKRKKAGLVSPVMSCTNGRKNNREETFYLRNHSPMSPYFLLKLLVLHVNHGFLFSIH